MNTQTMTVGTYGKRTFSKVRYERINQARLWFHSLDAEDVEKVFLRILMSYPGGQEIVNKIRGLWIREDLKDTHVLSLYQAYNYFCSGSNESDAKTQ